MKLCNVCGVATYCTVDLYVDCATTYRLSIRECPLYRSIHYSKSEAHLLTNHKTLYIHVHAITCEEYGGRES